MKNLTWKQWTAFGIIIAIIITLLILHFVQPEVSYAFLEIATICAFIIGIVTGYLLKKTNIIKE